MAAKKKQMSIKIDEKNQKALQELARNIEFLSAQQRNIMSTLLNAAGLEGNYRPTQDFSALVRVPEEKKGK